MSDVAAPQWARLTSADLGRALRSSSGTKWAVQREVSPMGTGTEDFVRARKTFGNSRSGGHGKKAQIERAGSRSRHVTVYRAPLHCCHLAVRRPSGRGHAGPE